MKICYIIGAGELPLLYIKKENSMLIAADGGFAKLQNLTPDITVGDFDSLGFVPGGKTVTLPTKKDVTDMKYAVDVGIEKGFNTFVLYGGTGGRPDHTFANYALLCSLAKSGKRAYLIGDGFVATAICNSCISLPKKEKGTVSVFSADTAANGVTIEGLEYTLKNENLTFCEPLGVSNSFVGKENKISVKDGTLLIMWEENNVKNFIDNLYK
ncbi:MAG: thiamine diphosphokinase [Clostridia bacterium]|nr:thiamine diphosphokinase [Clostridia bacterium]